jgi:hypothetical protein
VLPDLQSDGTLPPGVHWADSWKELEKMFGANPHRRRLLAGLREAAENLRRAGCKNIFVDGSFVTAKQMPNDYDACWDVVGVNPNDLDPILLDFSNQRAAQKARFGGELFPAEWSNGRTGMTFLEFFQVDKSSGNPKGIVGIDLERCQP